MLDAVAQVLTGPLSRLPEKAPGVAVGASASAKSLNTATGLQGPKADASSRGLPQSDPVDSHILKAAQDSLLLQSPSIKAGSRVRNSLPGPETRFQSCAFPENPGQFNASALAEARSEADTQQGRFTGPVNQIRSAASSFGATPFADIQSMEAIVTQFFEQAQAIGAFRSRDVASVDAAIDGQLPDVMSLLSSQVFGSSVSPEFGQGLALLIQNLQLSVGQSASGVRGFCEDSLDLPSASCAQLSVLAQQLQAVVSTQIDPAYSSGMAGISTALEAVMVQLRAQIHTSDALYKSDVDGSVEAFSGPIVRLTPSSTDITAAQVSASDAFLGVVGTPARIDSLYDALTGLVQSLFLDPNIQALSLAHDIPLLTAEQARINAQKSDDSSEYNKLQGRISDKKRDFIISLVTSIFSLAYIIYTRVVVPRDVQRGYTRLTAFIGSDIRDVAGLQMYNATVVPHVPEQYAAEHTVDTQTQLRFSGSWFTEPSVDPQGRVNDPSALQQTSCIDTHLHNLDRFHNQLKACLSRAAYFELFKHFDSLETPTDILLLIGNLKKFYSTTGAPDASRALSGSTANDNFTKLLGGFLNNLIRVYQSLYREVTDSGDFRSRFTQTPEFSRKIRWFSSDADRIHRAFFSVNPESLSDTYEEPRAAAGPVADARRFSFVLALTHSAAEQHGIDVSCEGVTRAAARAGATPAVTASDPTVVVMRNRPLTPPRASSTTASNMSGVRYVAPLPAVNEHAQDEPDGLQMRRLDGAVDKLDQLPGSLQPQGQSSV